ncbi:tRNA (adenine-N(6)-)-methyltransferase [candidate division TA06 bacterium]|nr:tRNA (adenine-N(6)-)-methyltransferase [candidate division TA06 bacterium]
MKPPLRQGSANDFQTPAQALHPLYQYLKKDWTIWECAQGKGNIVRELRARGWKVIGTDILDGHDYLSYLPSRFNCMITNPPYSIKQLFLERAYSLQKPFAFLLPLTTFETRKRQYLFEKYGLEVIFFDKRINFETPSGRGTGAWFATAWFTWGLNIGKQMTFCKYE